MLTEKTKRKSESRAVTVLARLKFHSRSDRDAKQRDLFNSGANARRETALAVRSMEVNQTGLTAPATRGPLPVRLQATGRSSRFDWRIRGSAGNVPHHEPCVAHWLLLLLLLLFWAALVNVLTMSDQQIKCITPTMREGAPPGSHRRGPTAPTRYV